MKAPVILSILLSMVPFAQTKAKQTPPNWDLGVSIPVNQENISENMKWAAEAGFKWVEADMTSGYSPDPDRMKSILHDYKTAVDKAGLKIWSVHIPFGPSFDPSEADLEKRAECNRKILQAMDIAKELGPYQKAIIHPSFEPIKDDERQAKLEALKKSMDELGPVFIEKYNVRLALECLPRTCLANTSTETMDILNGRPYLDNCFDVNHLLKETPEHFAKVVGKRIGTLHISDYDNVNERHWIPGKGVIKWTDLVREIQKTGYDGPFMFEVTTTPWKDDMKQFYQDLAKSWEKIREDIKAGK